MESSLLPLVTVNTTNNTPSCQGMQELPNAADERRKYMEYCKINQESDLKEKNLATDLEYEHSPIYHHLSCGLALTTGSALGSSPPTTDSCLAAFLIPNSAGLTAGARAWTKHAHRSQPEVTEEDVKKKKESEGWWGRPSGPVVKINENATKLFWMIMNGATWRNLHWLPHQILVYEIRVEEGYGMRWSQNQRLGVNLEEAPWIFRGFVEPMMENGHELGWRRPVNVGT